MIARDGSRERVIERYEQWLFGQPRLLAALNELAGKTLACWCAPRACHGDVLARLAAQPTPMLRLGRLCPDGPSRSMR